MRDIRRSRTARRCLTTAALLAAGAATACGDGPVPPAAPAPSDVVVPAPAGLSASRQTLPAVRLDGHYTGSVTVVALPNDPLANAYRVEAVADGITTHVGRTHVAWAIPRVQLDLAGGRLTVLSGTWSVTLTAAGGDRLVAQYTFPTPVVAFDALGRFSAAADLVVTGGTGRFAGSTGRGVVTLRGNVLTGQFTADLESLGAFAVPR